MRRTPSRWRPRIDQETSFRPQALQPETMLSKLDSGRNPGRRNEGMKKEWRRNEGMKKEWRRNEGTVVRDQGTGTGSQIPISRYQESGPQQCLLNT
ncbi:MAG: hypothetical protein WCJ45_05830 [bacterium]